MAETDAAQLFVAKSRKRRNDQNQCSNRHGTDSKLRGSVVLASIGMAEQGRRNDKQQGSKSEVSQEHEFFAKRDPEFAAARGLKSWNGWKNGTTANMQMNDQEDNIRK